MTTLPPHEQLTFDELHRLVVAFYSLNSTQHYRKELDTYLIKWQSCSNAWGLIQQGLFSEETNRCESEVKLFLATTLKNKVIFDFYQVPSASHVPLIDLIIKRGRRAIQIEKCLPLAEQLGVVLAHICIHLNGEEWMNPLSTYESSILNQHEGSFCDNLTLYLLYVQVLVQESFGAQKVVVQRFKRNDQQEYLNFAASEFMNILNKAINSGTFENSPEELVQLTIDTTQEWLNNCEALEAIVPAMAQNKLCELAFEWSSQDRFISIREKSLALLSSIMYHISEWALRDASSSEPIHQFLMFSIDKLADEKLYNICMQSIVQEDWDVVLPYVTTCKYLVLALAPLLIEIYWPSSSANRTNDLSKVENVRIRKNHFDRMFQLMHRASQVEYDPDERHLSSWGICAESYRFWWKLSVEFLRGMPNFVMESSPVASTGTLSAHNRSCVEVPEIVQDGKSRLMELLLPVFQSIPRQLMNFILKHPTGSHDYNCQLVSAMFAVPSIDMDMIVKSHEHCSLDTGELNADFHDFMAVVGKLCNRIHLAMAGMPDAFWSIWASGLPMNIDSDESAAQAIASLLMVSSVMKQINRWQVQDNKAILIEILTHIVSLRTSWFGPSRTRHSSRLKIIAAIHYVGLIESFIGLPVIGRGLLDSQGYPTEGTVQNWMNMCDLVFDQILVASDLISSVPTNSDEFILAIKLSSTSASTFALLIEAPPIVRRTESDVGKLNSLEQCIVNLGRSVMQAYDQIPIQTMSTIIEALVPAASYIADDHEYFNFIIHVLFDPMYYKLSSYLASEGPGLISVIQRPGFDYREIVSSLDPSRPLLDCCGIMMGVTNRYDIISVFMGAFSAVSRSTRHIDHPSIRDLRSRGDEIKSAVFIYVAEERMWAKTVDLLKASCCEELAEKGVRCIKYLLRMPCRERIVPLLLKGCDVLQEICMTQDVILSCHLYMGQLFAIDAYRSGRSNPTVSEGIKNLFETLATKAMNRIKNMGDCIPRGFNDTIHSPSMDCLCILEDYFNLLHSFLTNCPVPCGASPIFLDSIRLVQECRWIEQKKVNRAAFRFLLSALKLPITWPTNSLNEWPSENDVKTFNHNIQSGVMSQLQMILTQWIEVLITYPPDMIIDHVIRLIDTIKVLITPAETVQLMRTILNDRSVIPAEIFPTEVEQGHFLSAVGLVEDKWEDGPSESEDDLWASALGDAVYDLARIGYTVLRRHEKKP